MRGRPRRFRNDAYLARSELKLLDVTTLWPWVFYPKSCFGRTRRDDERDVEDRITLSMVPHKQRFVVTFKEALARLVDGLVTLMVINSDGT